ncbi:MAG: cell division protein FtsZ [Nanoarchaeota archaeon]|nr:cell division protein FtsZ [Nanoarchaeota archaeon]
MSSAKGFGIQKEEPSYEKEVRPDMSRTLDVDAELEELLSKKKAAIKVVGVGGAGNNTITRMTDVGIKGAELIAMNTDAQDLLVALADKKLLLGRDVTGGLGAGADPKKGEEAAKETEQEIKQALQGADMVFITCGLGGGTGTGGAPVVAEVAKKIGALTVGVVTLPFGIEGRKRMANAQEGLEKLQGIVDTLIVIPNDKLLEIAPDLPLFTAFKVADEILTNAVKGIAEMVTKPGLINLDFADIKAVMKEGGVAMIGVGESDTENRAIEAVEKAIQNPLLDVDISGAKGALINVAGGANMTLEEARQVVQTVSEKLDGDAKIIWGAQISNDLQDTIRTILIVTGVQSPQIFGPSSTFEDQRKRKIEKELGIEFLR